MNKIMFIVFYLYTSIYLYLSYIDVYVYIYIYTYKRARVPGFSGAGLILVPPASAPLGRPKALLFWIAFLLGFGMPKKCP